MTVTVTSDLVTLADRVQGLHQRLVPALDTVVTGPGATNVRLSIEAALHSAGTKLARAAIEPDPAESYHLVDGVRADLVSLLYATLPAARHGGAEVAAEVRDRLDVLLRAVTDLLVPAR